MAAPALAHPRYAIDTNVLIDLAQGRQFAQRLLAKLRIGGQGVAVLPTVIQELTHFALNPADHRSKDCLAVLQNLRRWQMQTFDLVAVGHAITAINADKLIKAGLLPESEFNDGLLIIETALCCIPTLISSDQHLLNINPAKLTSMLTEIDLRPVSIFHPKAMLP